ncbi:MAG: molybdopterin oxidoreductase family protein, partial [Acidimicrobiales bacterium]
PVTCVLGRPSIAERPEPIVEAAALLLGARPDVRFLSALRRGNVHGAVDMGLAPGLLPGRVALDDGREWYRDAWDMVPVERGLDATGILTAAAEGKIETLVLLGADPLTDFPDRDLATRGLTGARTVIAVDCFLTDSARQADVVLPVGGYAETGGTTTNLEGRVSRLHRKVTPPGTARDYWVIATDLAYRLGSDLGLESLEAIWAEVERLSAAHAGVTRAVLDSPSARDGVVVPVAPGTVFADAGGPGGPLSGEQGTPVSIEGTRIAPDQPDGEAHPADEAGEPAETDEPAEPAPGRPPLVRFTRPAEPAPAPPPDSYSLRLVASRKLYDRGTWVAHAPSLAGLAPGTAVRCNPADVDRIGVSDGGRVKATSSRGSATVEVVRDPGVPKGVAAIYVNQEGPNPTEFIDASAPVTEIRLETV